MSEQYLCSELRITEKSLTGALFASVACSDAEGCSCEDWEAVSQQQLPHVSEKLLPACGEHQTIETTILHLAGC